MSLEDTPIAVRPFSSALELEVLRQSPRLSAPEKKKSLSPKDKADQQESSCVGIGSTPYWVAAGS
jgi:hypothetical protein